MVLQLISISTWVRVQATVLKFAMGSSEAIATVGPVQVYGNGPGYRVPTAAARFHLFSDQPLQHERTGPRGACHRSCTLLVMDCALRCDNLTSAAMATSRTHEDHVVLGLRLSGFMPLLMMDHDCSYHV